ncbi:Agamous-like MADS-box protein AGL62 [Apostasia shenzhenica]|uniref:Agamous-like MADS-box protein AGL62 n=1 Tax=Apostasia shenzhenica TaxID=1088818 RepID=A0A2I0BDW9_9ASPA|nr:Agamous-like MADS-box protein AGL62 [Apostasia shenzhenica]
MQFTNGNNYISTQKSPKIKPTNRMHLIPLDFPLYRSSPSIKEEPPSLLLIFLLLLLLLLLLMSAINVIARRKRKASSGRRKIEIKKIENEDARHVSFSKRRCGLFTKACDLATLCGVELAIVVYSAAGNPYSFGSPTVDSVVDRFLAGRPDRVEPGRMNQAGLVQVLNQQCMDLAAQIRAAEERRSSLELRIRAAGESNLLSQLTNDEEDASPMQLEKLKKLLLDLRRKVDYRFADLLSGKEAIEFNSNLTSSQLVELDVVGGWPGYEL